MNQTTTISQAIKREFSLDLLRVLACFLVIWQHVTEVYYIGPDFTVPTHDEMPLMLDELNDAYRSTLVRDDFGIFPFASEDGRGGFL